MNECVVFLMIWYVSKSLSIVVILRTFSLLTPLDSISGYTISGAYVQDLQTPININMSK